MQTRTMRSIDALVGKPLCRVLTIVRRARLALGLQRRAPESPRKILFIKLEEQGAIVVAAPAIRHAEALVGRENLYFITFDHNRPILDLMNLVPQENIFTIRSFNPVHIALDTLRAAFRARRLEIDSTIDMEFFARGSAILTYLCGSARRVGLHGYGKAGPYRGDLMTHRVFYNPYLHTGDAYQVLVRALQTDRGEVPMLKEPVRPTPPDLPLFRPRPATREAVRDALARAGVDSAAAPVMVLQPNCGDVLRVRKWREEHYVALGRRLLEEYAGAALLLTGLPQEAETLREMAAAMGPRAHVLAGLLDLEGLLTLFTVADVLVTNDSGPAHFAAVTPIHLVALYGPETPALFGPMTPRLRVLYRNFACSPCLTAFNFRLSPCQNNQCIQSITVDAVFEAVADCLRERVEGAGQQEGAWQRDGAEC